MGYPARHDEAVALLPCDGEGQILLGPLGIDLQFVEARLAGTGFQDDEADELRLHRVEGDLVRLSGIGGHLRLRPPGRRPGQPSAPHEQHASQQPRREPGIGVVLRHVRGSRN